MSSLRSRVGLAGVTVAVALTLQALLTSVAIGLTASPGVDASAAAEKGMAGTVHALNAAFLCLDCLALSCMLWLYSKAVFRALSDSSKSTKRSSGIQLADL